MSSPINWSTIGRICIPLLMIAALFYLLDLAVHDYSDFLDWTPIVGLKFIGYLVIMPMILKRAYAVSWIRAISVVVMRAFLGFMAGVFLWWKGVLPREVYNAFPLAPRVSFMIPLGGLFWWIVIRGGLDQEGKKIWKNSGVSVLGMIYSFGLDWVLALGLLLGAIGGMHC